MHRVYSRCIVLLHGCAGLVLYILRFVMTRLNPESSLVAPDQQASVQNNPVAVEEVLSGKETIVSHVGTSQYQAGGIAACGLAGLNFVRIVLGRVEEGLEGGAFAGRCALAKNQRRGHLHLFSMGKQCPPRSRGYIPGYACIQEVLKPGVFDLWRAFIQRISSRAFRAAVHPNICCSSHNASPRDPIDSPTGRQDVFIIFDSHPRTNHPDGAGLIVNTSLDATAAHLDNILAVDSRVLADRSLQWQAQLLAQFSAHLFIARAPATNDVKELTEAVLESSLVALGLHAEVSDLKFQNSNLSRERQSLERELDELKDKYRSIQRTLEYFSSPANIIGSPSCSESADYRVATQLQMGIETDIDRGHRHSRHASRSSYAHSVTSKPRDVPMDDYMVAAQLQMDWDQAQQDDASKAQALQREFEAEDALLVAERAALQKEVQAENAFRSSYAHSVTSKPRDVPMDDYMVAAQLQMDWDRAQQDDASKAQALQREFEAEDALLVAERAALQKEVQAVFECGVCFDKYPEDYVTRIPDCTHGFCRDCMKGYVVSKLQDKLYPIFCPICVTDNARVEPGVISDDLVQMLGLNDNQYRILQELQIASLSILLHCRKCKESVFVDRAEYEAAPILVCHFRDAITRGANPANK
ncbi:hypothetical protein B0H14DRAFT_274801 [Mycena olivaceomarginata]|nr:hypothetical protein B0H14DRAFT_274801 [Mycena olivaceomarginata]